MYVFTCLCGCTCKHVSTCIARSEDNLMFIRGFLPLMWDSLSLDKPSWPSGSWELLLSLRLWMCTLGLACMWTLGTWTPPLMQVRYWMDPLPGPSLLCSEMQQSFLSWTGDFSSPVFLLESLWRFPNIWIWVVRKIHKKCLDISIIILNRRLKLRNPLFFLAFWSLLQ